MPQHDENTSGTNDASGVGGVSRRSLVKAAAWSAPVVALAVGAPAQAGSGATITVDFVATGLFLHHSTTLSVLVSITNSGTNAVSDSAQFDITNVPADLVVDYDTTEREYEAPSDSGTTNTPVDNSLFFLAGNGSDATSYSFVSAGALDIPARSTVYFFFTISWPAHNSHVGGFVLLGSFRFGTGSLLQLSSDRLPITYDNDVPSGG